MRPAIGLAINALAFKVVWTASILGAANDWPLLGLAVASVAITLHLVSSAQVAAELLLILSVGFIGATADSLLLNLGLLDYPTGSAGLGFAPIWIVSLWMTFATTLNSALRWLQGRTLLAALLGAISGPFSYLAGAQLGAVEIHGQLPAYLAISATWAALLPLLVRLAALCADRSTHSNPFLPPTTMEKAS